MKFPRSLSAVALVFLLSACSGEHPQSSIDPRTDFAESIHSLYLMIFWITLAILVFVWAVYGVCTGAVSSDRLIYPYYELAPRVTSLGPLEDQRLGGLLMWIPGMLIFWVAITAIWFRWTREEYQEWRREAGEFAARP